jgi:ferredoxin
VITRPTARFFRIRLERRDRSWTFEAREDEYLLYSMLDSGIDSPYICEQGWCLACAARLKSGSVEQKDALTFYPEDSEAGFVLLCSTKPRSDLVLVQD